jgi:hypothetical protein
MVVLAGVMLAVKVGGVLVLVLVLVLMLTLSVVFVEGVGRTPSSPLLVLPDICVD